MNTVEYVEHLLRQMRQINHPKEWRTFELRIQEELLTNPWIYQGKLREEIKSEFHRLDARRNAAWASQARRRA